jgi:putative DNA primase/helicase
MTAPPVTASGLRPADLAMFERFGIPLDLLDAAKVRRITTEQARELLSSRHPGNLAGLLFSYHDPESGHPVGSRVRRDHHEIENGKARDKYLSAYGDIRHLFFSPGAGPLLGDVSATVVLVEAEKSALTLTAAATRASRRLLAVAMGGDWGWKGTIGKTTDAAGARVDVKGPLPDLNRIAWTDRDVVVMLDANVSTNNKVQAAQRALASELAGRGARVRIANLPVEDGVNGPDDFRAVHGDAALFAVLDAAQPAKVKAGKPEPKKQGREVQLDDPEPWPDPVDGPALLDSIADVLAQYVALPAHAAVTIALWLLHTYLIGEVFTTPNLAITSPTKRCGKTLLLIVAGSLVPRRLFTANVTPAVLFRAIEKYRPTLLIDEADSFVRENEELRGVLNSGHTKTTATVLRAVGDDHEPRLFSTWCAKAIALIGALPATLADRSIEVKMRRRAAGEPVARLRQDRIDGECADLRRQAARWAADHADVIRAADPDVPGTLHDRAADCWRPLLAVADAAGGTWPDQARLAAVGLAGSQDEGDVAVELLADIKEIVEDTDADLIGSSVLLERLVGMEGRPWADYRNGKAMTPHGLARLLKRFEVFPCDRRQGEKVLKSYRRDDFGDAFARYLPLKSQHRNKVNENGPELPFSNRNIEQSCCDLRTATKPMNTKECCGVAIQQGGLRLNLPDEGDDDARLL